jgi:hypothetical protein
MVQNIIDILIDIVLVIRHLAKTLFRHLALGFRHLAKTWNKIK